MVDLHCHILPGVDDGSSCLGDSLDMARIAAESGTHVIAATLHCNIPGYVQNYWSEDLQARLTRLQTALKEQNIPLQIVPGQEIFLAGPVQNLLRQGKLITLNRSRYALVEVDMGEHFADTCRKLQQVQAEGIVPILAHPERYSFLMADPERALQLRSMGVLLQSNGGSLLGHFGRGPMHTSWYLIEHRLTDFIASDAHSQFRRIPNLGEFHEWISENISADYADFLLKYNPRQVLKDGQACHF